MDKKEELALKKQLVVCRRELNKLVSMTGFSEIDLPTPDGMRKIGDKLKELVDLLDSNRL